MTMGFWDDYATAVQFYPETNVTLAIVDVDPAGDGSAINEGEQGSFKIQITNNGPLSLRDIEFHVKGLNGMQVRAGAAHDWDDDFVTNNVSVDFVEHNQTKESQDSPYQFLAPADPQPVRNLIEVSLADWTADPLHIHTNHTGELPNVKATFRSRVAPQ
jgi:hypothetical protein